MTCEQVYKSVRRFVLNHEHKLENVFVHSWEADMFSVTKTGYAYETEIKVSRSDFFVDFKKPKHHYFKTYKKGFGTLPGDRSWTGAGWLEVQKSPELKDYRMEYCTFKSIPFDHKHCPNKFIYAVPVGMVEAHEVPDYAGLMYVMDSGDFRMIKQAPYLHKDIINVKEMLFTKYYYLHIEQKQRIRELESTVKYLEGKLNPVSL